MRGALGGHVDLALRGPFWALRICSLGAGSSDGSSREREAPPWCASRDRASWEAWAGVATNVHGGHHPASAHPRAQPTCIPGEKNGLSRGSSRRRPQRVVSPSYVCEMFIETAKRTCSTAHAHVPACGRCVQQSCMYSSRTRARCAVRAAVYRYPVSLHTAHGGTDCGF